MFLWDVSVKLWQAHACSIANRNLTKAEWAQFFGSEPYHKTCPNMP